MEDMSSKHVPGLETYPKIVYPEGHTAHFTNAGSHGVGEFQGTLVHTEAQEEWVKSGKKLEDFGKDALPAPVHPLGWVQPKA